MAPYQIVGGHPAKILGVLFADEKQIQQHEKSLRDGVFEFSERGFDCFVVRTAMDSDV